MIGYYIHHHGRGHQTRAAAISAHLVHEVTALTSILAPLEPVYSDIVRLPRDDHDPDPLNPTANGQLHWAPLHDRGLSERMYLLGEWIRRCRPSAIVVDVSVEVATAARLFGIPVIVIAMPGDRTDRPHELVYGLADHIIAAWPGHLYAPKWLAIHAHKTTFVGGVSRFDGLPSRPGPTEDKPLALVVGGGGGSDLTVDTVAEWAAGNPGYRWETMGVAGAPWVANPWSQLCRAAVVISAAGQNAIADIACAQRPAVVVPQPRPFGEQTATAGVLERGGLAITRPTWPTSGQWAETIGQAQGLDSRRWHLWQTGGAAKRAAETIERVADHLGYRDILT